MKGKGTAILLLGIVAFLCVGGVVSLSAPSASREGSSRNFLGVLAIILLGALALVAAVPRVDDTRREPMLRLVRANFTRLNPKFGKIPLFSGDGAYTDNKSVITLCLKDPVTQQPYDSNTVTFVALHKLAHVVSKNIGHGDEFLQNFEDLRERAQRLGFFDPRQPITQTYCGTSGTSE